MAASPSIDVDLNLYVGIVRPGDKLVVAISHQLSNGQGALIRQRLEAAMPGVEVVLISASALVVYRSCEPAEGAPQKPEVLGHPDDAAEEWLAGEFEEDRSTVGVAYERSQMIDAFRAGSDWAREQIAKFGKDADGRWITR